MNSDCIGDAKLTFCKTGVDQMSIGLVIAVFFLEENGMNKNKITGVWQSTKGKVKVGVGHAIGNIKMEVEGLTDQLKGKINKNIGKVKAAAKGTKQPE